MPNLNRQIITKKIIDAFVDFLKSNVATNKLYNSTKVSDRFAYDTALIPCVIIRQTSNTQRRIHFNDYMKDWNNRVQLIPISGDNTIVGNNTERVNLPIQVDWNPTWSWDTSIPLPSGSDITQVIMTSGTPPYNTTDITTGIIIEVPPPSTFDPTSIERAQEAFLWNPYTWQNETSQITSGSYNLAIGLAEDQFYLLYSGTGISGTNYMNVQPEQMIINPSGMPSGVSIKLNDVLMAGDQYVLNTYTDPQFCAMRFGGIYDITLNFDVYAMSTIECQELCDAVERFLVEKKQDLWSMYGFTATAWSKSGESEETHLNEYIFKAALTTQGIVEWYRDESVPLITSVEFQAIPQGGYTTQPINISGESHIQSGISINISGVQYIQQTPLNLVSTTSINNVYSIGISGNVLYPSSYIQPSGVGYFLSGNSVNWSFGTYTDFTTVIASGWVPDSGTTYLVDYTIFGYLAPGVITNNTTFDQSGPKNPLIGLPIVPGILMQISQDFSI